MAKEKVKKPFYKKWWVWLLAVIIVGSIATGGEEESAAPASTEPVEEETKSESTTANPEKAKEEKKKEEPKAFGIGEEVNVGDMTYKVNGTSTATEVGPSVLPQKAKGKYLVVDVTLKNNGNEAVTVDSSFFKLKRGEKTYETDSMGSMSANQGEDGAIENSFFLQELNPEMEISGKVVFDLAPETADATDLKLQVQTGVFGTETEVINLQ